MVDDNEREDKELDAWLAGPDHEADEPLAIHRFTLSMEQYQRANNTRWLARMNFRVGKDLGDEALMNSARIDAKRVRGLMEHFSKEAMTAWAEMPPERRHELYGGLPKEIKALIDAAGTSS